MNSVLLVILVVIAAALLIEVRRARMAIEGLARADKSRATREDNRAGALFRDLHLMGGVLERIAAARRAPSPPEQPIDLDADEEPAAEPEAPADAPVTAPPSTAPPSATAPPSNAPPRSRGSARVAELADEVKRDAEAKRSRPPAPFVPPELGPAPPGSRPVPAAAARAALPSVAGAEDEDSQDDPNTHLMTKPTAAELAAGAVPAGGLAPPKVAAPPAPPNGTIRVMGITPPLGAPARSSHRPPPSSPAEVSPLLAAAHVGGDDERTQRRGP
jgi:hypothetical protein